MMETVDDPSVAVDERECPYDTEMKIQVDEPMTAEKAVYQWQL